MNTELKELLNGMKANKIDDVEGVKNYMEGYVGTVLWSGVKTEWEGMDEEDREIFCEVVMNYLNRM